jgi:hypothetical protein
MLSGKNGVWLVVLSLAGCVSVQQQQGTVASQAPAARPVVLQEAQARPVAPVATARRGPINVNKVAAAGKPLTLNEASAGNADCTLQGLPTGKVIQEPAHGAVKFVTREVFPTYPPNNPHFSCNTVKIKGIVAEYTSIAGFTGADSTIVEYIFPDGRDMQIQFAIMVK